MLRLSTILPYHHSDNIDRVFGLDAVYSTGGSGVVYHHFQRWLNTQSLDEKICKESLRAMALPFGEDIVAKNMKEFRLATDGTNYSATGFGSYITL